jgi:hypothetical protein
MVERCSHQGGIKAIQADRRRGEAYADMLVDALIADDRRSSVLR